MRHKRALGAGMALAGVYAALVAMIPWIQQVIVDDAIVRHTVPIAPWLAVMAAVGVAVLGISFTWRYLAVAASNAVQLDIRNAMYDALQRLDFAGHSRLQSGQLVSRASSDLRWVQIFIGWFPQLTSTIVGAVVSVVVMVVLSPILAAIVVVIVGGVFAVTQRMRRNAHAAGWQAQQFEADMTTQVEESVTGVRVVRGFGQEDQESRRLHKALVAMFRARVRALRLRAPFFASIATGPQLGIAVVLLVGGIFVLDGRIEVGVFLAFTGYLTGLAGAAQTAGMVLSNMPQCEAAIERIGQVLDLAPSLTDPAEPVVPPRSGSIEFDHVRFRYDASDEHPVLDGLDLSVKPGESVALVGTIGSGKSTLLHLIPRFHDADGGRVLVDGVDVRRQSLEDLRSRVGVVFENSFLFSDTIASNIAYGVPDASDEEIRNAARSAMAHDFIMETPDGYATVIGEQGMTLSGGQRQRIALARAILTDPEILLLDDATSSVDVSVERDIHANLGPFLAARTTLIVAYRESTVMMADRVAVIDGGRVADTGTHDELFSRNALYRSLFDELDADHDDEDAAGMLEDARAGRLRPTSEAWTKSEQGAPPLLDLSISPAVQARIDALPEFDDRTGVDIAAEASNREPFRLARFVRPYRRGFAVGLMFVVFQVLIGLLNPLVVRSGVDAGMLGKSVPMLLAVFGAAVVLAVLLFADQRAAQVWTQRTTERLLLALRTRVYGQLQRLGIDFYDRTQTGRIMTRMTSDIDAISQLLQTGVINLIMSVLTFAGMSVVIVVLDWRLALVVLCVVPPAAAVTWWYRRHASVAYDEVRERASLLNSSLQESLAGIRVTQAYRRERRNLADFGALGGEYLAWTKRSAVANSTYVSTIELLSTLATTAVLGVGYLLISQGGLGIGTLLAFLLYLAQVFAPIQQISTVFDAYQRARAGMVRIRELLSLDSGTPEHADPRRVPDLEGDIRLEGVRLRYAGTSTDALQRVDLHVPAGQRVAFVGRTGAGKSTTVKMITRFYDPTEGRILIDGIDLGTLATSDYRHRLGYVPQEPFLFSRTIRDNIAYAAPDAGDAEVEAAARIVGAHEFISRLPRGYHETVTERGRSLSNGQRQLICLARALIVDPAILILDEATSNLDLSSERRVNRAMRRIAAGRTTLAVTHRPQSLHWVQRVLVVSHGRIVDDTTPQRYLTLLQDAS